ncbi:MAG: alpha/beta hydrolase [Chloroflexi bacterium]|nr:alpha/beta hydrolase [Chloroflexota bacterium]
MNAPTRDGASAPAATPDERLVDVLGVQSRVSVLGDGPPLLYLHGANGPGWPPGLRALAERFTVYQPEHPGFGTSERPEHVETAQDLALHYLDLIPSLGLRTVCLVGQSLGGWIAAEMATLCTHDLSRLVLMGAAGLLLPDEQGRVDLFALNPEKVTRALFYDQALAERALAVTPTPEDIHAAVRNRAMTARLGWSPYMANTALRTRLRRIRIPTLVVWGAQDALMPRTHAEAYRDAIPGASLELIEACGHLPAVEQPAAFARVVGDFLSAPLAAPVTAGAR